MITKDVGKYLKGLRQRGYRTVPTNGMHYKIYFGDQLVATSGGGKEHHSLANLSGQVRRFERQQGR
jgi:hypothetical protein